MFDHKINVLDKGYVRLVDVMGSDLSIVNAARVSFNRENDTLTAKDIRLINFLVRSRPPHTSPFRHAFATFEVKSPLMIARQWWKYVVGSDHTMDGWNELSRRYVVDDLEFYLPAIGKWRAAPENKKQGSGKPLPPVIGLELLELLEKHIARGVELYEYAISEGLCAEQARLFLSSNGQYTTWRWSASIQSVGHFLCQRLQDDAQVEIQAYAKAVQTLITPHFPVSIPAYIRYGGGIDAGTNSKDLQSQADGGGQSTS